MVYRTHLGVPSRGVSFDHDLDRPWRRHDDRPAPCEAGPIDGTPWKERSSPLGSESADLTQWAGKRARLEWGADFCGLLPEQAENCDNTRDGADFHHWLGSQHLERVFMHPWAPDVAVLTYGFVLGLAIGRELAS